MSERRHLKKAAKGDKLRVERGTMRVRAFHVLADAIDSGVDYGWRRAFKHDVEPAPEDGPRAAHVREDIRAAIMNAICEVFDFPEDQT